MASGNLDVLAELYQGALAAENERDFFEYLKLIRDFETGLYDHIHPTASFAPLLYSLLKDGEIGADTNSVEAFSTIKTATSKSSATRANALVQEVKNLQTLLAAEHESKEQKEEEHEFKEQKEEKEEVKLSTPLEQLLSAIVPHRKIQVCRPDGSCGFEAVGKFLVLSSTAVRKLLEKQLRDKTVAEQVKLVVGPENVEQWESLLKRISNIHGDPDSWINSDILRALSFLLNKNIYVIDGDKLTIRLYPKGMAKRIYSLPIKPSETDIGEKDIVLLLRNYHFDALV